ncbi:hypothetical protein C7M84_024641 [Penaeus vannamei]|uniref:Reverse transcriptase domain-containing protein n=1 Tax=Penaeus vannamei TaxID=6689 RepID=A0A423U0G3_PENVA|nr:hypothetical protein C7M84_024641 [Penaeus vannamei]
MWTKLRLASGAKCSMLAPHPHPHSEANRLALSFATPSVAPCNASHNFLAPNPRTAPQPGTTYLNHQPKTHGTCCAPSLHLSRYISYLAMETCMCSIAYKHHSIPSIHIFLEGTGTAHITTLLSLTDGNDSVIVFLDLEKAFELANRDAILHILAEKGVKGMLLQWVKDYISNRKVRVKFQGRTSEFYPFEIGIPQGGLLSPFLFNLLIVKLADTSFPNNTHLIAYADDFQLVVTGRNRLTSSKLGAGFRTLRLFYIHAVRSLIDYSAPALLTLSPQDIVTQETIQNRAMRVILAAPRWARHTNIRMNSFLPSLKCRMHQLTAGVVAKMLCRSRPSPLKHITANLLNPNEIDSTTFVWHASLIKALQSLDAIPMIYRGMDAPILDMFLNHLGLHKQSIVTQTLSQPLKPFTQQRF